MCIAFNSEGTINATATLTVMSKILLMELIGGIRMELWGRITVMATEYIKLGQVEGNNLIFKSDQLLIWSSTKHTMKDKT